MRLVMGGESLLAPLTGIGQYTYNLATELLKTPQISELNFLVDGFLRPSAGILQSCEEQARPQSEPIPASQPTPLLSRLRPIAAKNRLLVGLYGQIVPAIEARSLKGYSKNDLFHSPNNMLSSFPGHRIVTVLDLSTYRHPEHHPAARVEFVNRHIENAVQKADHIVTISNLVRWEMIERFNISEDRISTTYLGADQRFTRLSRQHFSCAGKQLGVQYKEYFLFVASIEPRKNLGRLLDAYLKYREEAGSNALPLLVIGSVGWQSEHIHERLKALESCGDVVYLGYVNQRLLSAAMAGARALLYPSVYEGFGLPVLEAMQAGTAVLTSVNTAMAEVCGPAAVYVDPLQTDNICEAILSLSQDHVRLKALEEQGLQRAECFSWQDCARQTLKVYGTLTA